MEHKSCSLASPHPVHLNNAITFIGRAFRAGAPLRAVFDTAYLLYGHVAWKHQSAQNALLQHTVLYSDHLTKRIVAFSFGQRRCARFLRILMDQIDHTSGADIDETLALLAAQYCQLKEHPNPNNYVMLYMPNKHQIVLSVSDNFNNLGARVWEASLSLYSQLIEIHSHVRKHIRGATVLELGAGTGLCASAYLAAGAKRVILTDVEQPLVNRIHQNLRNNQVAHSIQAQLLDAAHVRHLQTLVHQKNVNLIIAADVTYDDQLLHVMARAFATVVKDHVFGYVLVTIRAHNSKEKVKTNFNNFGLMLEEVDTRTVKNEYHYLDAFQFAPVCTFRISRTQ